MVTIELQYFDGCPNAAAALELVNRYRQEHPHLAITVVQVQDDEQAVRIGFRGSPTILINGRDWFDMPLPDQPHLACRFCPAGIPSLELFSEMVRKMTSI